MRVVEQLHVLFQIPEHADKFAVELLVVSLIHPSRAEAHGDLARRQRHRLHFFERGGIPLVFGVFCRNCPRTFQFRYDLPRKVFLRRYKARIFILRIDLFGVAEHRVAEFKKNAVVVLARQFLDIRYIHPAALVLGNLQRFERVVRACRHDIRADGSAEENICLRDRFRLFIDVFRRQQQRAVAVLFEQLAVRLAVQVAVSLYEQIVLRVELFLFVL